MSNKTKEQDLERMLASIQGTPPSTDFAENIKDALFAEKLKSLTPVDLNADIRESLKSRLEIDAAISECEPIDSKDQLKESFADEVFAEKIANECTPNSIDEKIKDSIFEQQLELGCQPKSLNGFTKAAILKTINRKPRTMTYRVITSAAALFVITTLVVSLYFANNKQNGDEDLSTIGITEHWANSDSNLQPVNFHRQLLSEKDEGIVELTDGLKRKIHKKYMESMLLHSKNDNKEYQVNRIKDEFHYVDIEPY